MLFLELGTGFMNMLLVKIQVICVFCCIYFKLKQLHNLLIYKFKLNKSCSLEWTYVFTWRRGGVTDQERIVYH